MQMRRWLIAIPCCLAVNAAASERAAGWQFSAALTPVYLASANIDSGGDYESRVLALNVGGSHPVGPRATAGVTFNYAHYDNRFAAANAFGTPEPWGNVERVGLSVPVFLRTAEGWALVATPSADYFHERGADWGESLTYGAILSASRFFSPRHHLGFGLGVFQQLEEVSAFPFLVVDWQLSDRVRLNNPLPAGPTGPAGLELNYRTSARWEVGMGAAYRRLRFRLRDDGAFPGGVGQESGIIAFLHAATRFGADASLDLYGGVLLDGELQVEDDNGDNVAQYGFDSAPLLGATLRVRF
jgi:hypothetical protein